MTDLAISKQGQGSFFNGMWKRNGKKDRSAEVKRLRIFKPHTSRHNTRPVETKCVGRIEELDNVRRRSPLSHFDTNYCPVPKALRESLA